MAKGINRQFNQGMVRACLASYSIICFVNFFLEVQLNLPASENDKMSYIILFPISWEVWQLTIQIRSQNKNRSLNLYVFSLNRIAHFSPTNEQKEENFLLSSKVKGTKPCCHQHNCAKSLQPPNPRGGHMTLFFLFFLFFSFFLNFYY